MSKKVLPKKDLDSTAESIIQKVVDLLSPKIDKLYEKITSKYDAEIKDIRNHLADQPSSSPITPSPQQKGNVGDQLEALMGSLASGNIPLQQQQPPDQNFPNQQQNPMGIIELAKLWKMFDTPDQVIGGLSPKMMQEIQMRQQIAMSNLTSSMFTQVTKEIMKKLGTDDQIISNMIKTDEHLMKPLHNLGSDNEKAKLLAKAKEIVDKKNEQG